MARRKTNGNLSQYSTKPVLGRSFLKTETDPKTGRQTVYKMRMGRLRSGRPYIAKQLVTGGSAKGGPGYVRAFPAPGSGKRGYEELHIGVHNPFRLRTQVSGEHTSLIVPGRHAYAFAKSLETREAGGQHYTLVPGRARLSRRQNARNGGQTGEAGEAPQKIVLKRVGGDSTNMRRQRNLKNHPRTVLRRDQWRARKLFKRILPPTEAERPVADPFRPPAKRRAKGLIRTNPHAMGGG